MKYFSCLLLFWSVLGVALAQGIILQQSQAQIPISPVAHMPTPRQMITLPGTSNARSLDTRFKAKSSVRDFGAIGNGRTDDTSAFQAAEEWNRTTSGQRMIWLDPGSYKLSGTVYNPSGSLWIVPPGASVSGGLLEGNTDGSTILPNHLGLALISKANIAGGSTLFVSNVVGDASAYKAYEMDGLYVNVATADPSRRANHDIVAGHFAAQISAGNNQGRSWGEDVTATVPANSDGYAVGEEISIGNNSNTTGAYGQPNSKLGLSVLAAGNTDSTAGVLIHDAGARFADGILSFTSAIRNSLLRLTNGSRDLAAIYADGSALFGKTTFTGAIRLQGVQTATLPASCLAGQQLYLQDGRNPGEAPDAGTGTVVFCNNKGVWLAANSGAPVSR